MIVLYNKICTAVHVLYLHIINNKPVAFTLDPNVIL